MLRDREFAGGATARFLAPVMVMYLGAVESVLVDGLAACLLRGVCLFTDMVTGTIVVTTAGATVDV